MLSFGQSCPPDFSPTDISPSCPPGGPPPHVAPLQDFCPHQRNLISLTGSGNCSLEPLACRPSLSFSALFARLATNCIFPDFNRRGTSSRAIYRGSGARCCRLLHHGRISRFTARNPTRAVAYFCSKKNASRTPWANPIAVSRSPGPADVHGV